MIWSDNYLNSLLTEAEEDIVTLVDCSYIRTALEVTKGKSTYILPSDLRSIIRITWKGQPLTGISFKDLSSLNPASFVVSETVKSEATESVPQFYCIHPTGSKNIRFYPTPNETLSTGDVYGAGISSLCVVSYWGVGDIPVYIARRTKKAYVMMKAFAKEGKGQNLQASRYFKKKYDFLISMFKSINSGVYAIRSRSITNETNLKSPKLPSNFENVHYR